MALKALSKCLVLSSVIFAITAHQCGELLFSKGFAIRGEAITRGQWPYLVALVNVAQNSFFCGGSLITAKHVLTAAHCIQPKHSSSKTRAEDVVVLAGKYNLEVLVEKKSVSVDVVEVRVHPDWIWHDVKYDADLAILVLEESVKFSTFIQPVCLPSSASIDRVFDGFVVGWGMSEFTEFGKAENIPRQVAIKAVEDGMCYTTDVAVASMSSYRTFCAGGKNAGPCFGDSGGGFFVKFGNHWTIKGIVSSSVLTKEKSCDVNRYSVYTNVIKFLDWIQINADMDDQRKILKCTFTDEHFAIFRKTWYTCQSANLEVLSENTEISSVTGDHIGRRFNGNVQILRLSRSVVKYIANNIGELFPKLKSLHCRNCHLEFISRKNFENMGSLLLLDLVHNEIESIPSDAFMDLKSLVVLDLMLNKIKALHADTFSGLQALQQISLHSNSLTEVPVGLFRNNRKIRFIDLSKNKLTEVEDDFELLPKLNFLNLSNNPCVSDVELKFDSSKDNNLTIGKFQEKINELCI